MSYNLPLILSTGMSTETEILMTNRLLDKANINRCYFTVILHILALQKMLTWHI